MNNDQLPKDSQEGPSVPRTQTPKQANLINLVVI